MADYKKKFNKIYDEYVGKIYRFVYVKVSSKETAEDLTSQAFTKSWQAMKGGADIKNPKAFVYQIARNLVIDFYRERAKRPTVSEEFIKFMPDQSVNIEQKAQQKALKSIIDGFRRMVDKFIDAQAPRLEPIRP